MGRGRRGQSCRAAADDDQIVVVFMCSFSLLPQVVDWMRTPCSRTVVSAVRSCDDLPLAQDKSATIASQGVQLVESIQVNQVGRLPNSMP